MIILKKIIVVLGIIAVHHFLAMAFLYENNLKARVIAGNETKFKKKADLILRDIGYKSNDNSCRIITSNDNNIDSLIRFFNQTTDNLKNVISGLSENQLQYKPNEEKWSISQCLEHIILSEKMLFEMAKKELDKPAQPNRRTDVQQTDENLINIIADRGQKFKAPKELQPSGKYSSADVAITDLIKARQPVLAYIQNANIDDLRNHVNDYPTGTVDGYQSLLFIAAHCTRHIKQIQEIKADSNFPKK